ncbi:Acid phosphatase Class B [Cinnamomum micranthum f. kanehirae]|uniref:Acid phosphatase Class B n=1 Tax=Cinnamomum micranthum f. kanehirae TaxID=337451 RepID=A0A443N4Y1_9MAGN|nr:Acid phosphatase Class B [Cinnamomum micranthum f. kanehirae]
MNHINKRSPKGAFQFILLTISIAMKPVALAILFLTTLLATSKSSNSGLPLPIYPLQPLTGSGHEHHLHGISCQSWRLGVETNNIQGWKTVPLSCEAYVGHYMLGHLYRQDSKVVTNEAALYAEGLNLTKDGKDVWVFDIDETTLSNLPYYAEHGFGAEPYNSTLFDAWVDTGKAPALPESLKLYKKLLSLGFKIVFLTGRLEKRREITVTNLKSVGYHTWEKLILKSSNDSGTALAIKSSKRKELEAQGYKILGNMGDQWSDILGNNAGQRTFKLPDPMYYIS